MAFSRLTRPADRPTPEALTRHMTGIGMAFAATPIPDANIEDVLLFASEDGMLEGDLRVLGILTQWIGVHCAHVNADRLVRVLTEHPEGRVRAYWSAVGAWLHRDRRLARWMRLYEGAPVDLLPVGTGLQIERRGEDARFRRSALRVPAGTLRERASDVLSPAQLAQTHAGYRNRVLMGPTWRADVWTALEREPTLTVAEAARRAYCAFGTAWQVKQDFEVLQEAT